MRILIVGSGGREHALAWKVAQSTQVTHVFVAPGNAGTARAAKVSNVAISATDSQGLLTFAQAEHIDLTIIGPEAPLADGIVDLFSHANLACFGPTKAAAQLEASKAFSKAFMQRHAIPTAQFATFTDLNRAIAYLETQSFPIVVKADGLAAGKGVIIAEDKTQAIQACHTLLTEQTNQQIVIEEYLNGEEASFMVIVDGLDFMPLATSQDHKARDDGDTGPNTGGMGAYSPAPVVTQSIEQHIIQDIIQPTLAGLKRDGIYYQGFLYAGLMIDKQGRAKVLEYNCRLGDPETQPIMMRLQSDLVELCQASLQHRLSQQTCQWDLRPALGVVLAVQGYPQQYQTGDPITGLERVSDDDVMVFHAGTRQQDNQVVTAGGRVLCVCALADTIAVAQHKAYQHIQCIDWQQQYYRRDIGHRAIQRQTE